MLGLIRSSFTCLTKDLMFPLYLSLVRHHLEYGAVLWNARATKAQIRAVEKVQMRAVSMVHGLHDMDYEDQLRALELTTLSARRARGMMIEMWKHFHVYDNDTLASSFKTGFSGRRKLECHRFSAEGIHKKTFLAAAAIAWNRLPVEVRASPTMNTFKARLDEHWCDLPLRYNFLARSPWALTDEIGEIPTLD